MRTKEAPSTTLCLKLCWVLDLPLALKNCAVVVLLPWGSSPIHVSYSLIFTESGSTSTYSMFQNRHFYQVSPIMGLEFHLDTLIFSFHFWNIFKKKIWDKQMNKFLLGICLNIKKLCVNTTHGIHYFWVLNMCLSCWKDRNIWIRVI